MNGPLPRSECTPQAGFVVPINTRFKGREAAYVLENSEAKMLFCVTDFLDTDYVALLQQAEVPTSLAEIVVMRGDCPTGTTSYSDFMARAAAVSEAERAARSARGQRRRPLPHHVHLRHHRQPQRRHVDPFCCLPVLFELVPSDRTSTATAT